MNSLYVPMSIRTRLEFFEGYGLQELGVTAVCTFLAGILAYFAHLVFGWLMPSILFTLIIMVATVMATTKDRMNLSIVDQVRNLVRFSKTQRKYPYVYRWEWF